MTAPNQVRALLADLYADRKTVEQVATAFRTLTWPKAPPAPLDDLADPEPFQPGSFDEVSVAYSNGHLTDAQYAVLAKAAARR